MATWIGIALGDRKVLPLPEQDEKAREINFSGTTNSHQKMEMFFRITERSRKFRHIYMRKILGVTGMGIVLFFPVNNLLKKL